MTTLPCYLVETRAWPAEAPGESVVSLFGPGTLSAYLTSNIEHEHYSGEGEEIMRLARYQAGTLVALHLHSTGRERGADDWLYWHYEVCDPETLHPDGSHVAELAFTVRIDGRA